MAGMYCMRDLLGLLLREGAGEMHLSAGSVPVIISHARKVNIEVPAITRDELLELLQSIATDRQMDELKTCAQLHFIYRSENAAQFAVSAVLEREVFDVTIKNLGR